MAESPKKRAWFQLHLSTCVVLMCVAGALVWANTIIEETGAIGVTDSGLQHTHAIFSPKGIGIQFVQGWPFPMRQSILIPEHMKQVLSIQESPPTWHIGNFFLNIIVALAILALSTVACEDAIRRRARKRLDPAL